MKFDQQKITQMLNLLAQGDKSVLDELVPIVYTQLRSLASHSMNYAQKGQTLNTTALVHEAYLKLAGQQKLDFRNRAHFFGVAAKAMRQIIVDFARKQNAAKRGSGQPNMPLDAQPLIADEQTEEILALEEGLQKLESVDQRKARIIELRYFAGLTIDETAEILHTSAATVKRDWNFSRAWLLNEIKGTPEN